MAVNFIVFDFSHRGHGDLVGFSVPSVYSVAILIRGDYNKGFMSDTCPRCDSRLKAWSELTDDERIAAEHQPASGDFPPAQRKKHRFCTRCWFEDTENPATA